MYTLNPVLGGLMRKQVRDRRRHLYSLAKAHKAADALLTGTYGIIQDGEFMGCSVGCIYKDIVGVSAKDYSDTAAYGNRDVYHKKIAEVANCPQWLIKFLDDMFEATGSRGDRAAGARFHVEFYKRLVKLPSEANWNRLANRFTVELIREYLRNNHAINLQNRRLLNDLIKRISELISSPYPTNGVASGYYPNVFENDDAGRVRGVDSFSALPWRSAAESSARHVLNAMDEEIAAKRR